MKSDENFSLPHEAKLPVPEVLSRSGSTYSYVTRQLRIFLTLHLRFLSLIFVCVNRKKTVSKNSKCQCKHSLLVANLRIGHDARISRVFGLRPNRLAARRAPA